MLTFCTLNRKNRLFFLWKCEVLTEWYFQTYSGPPGNNRAVWFWSFSVCSDFRRDVSFLKRGRWITVELFSPMAVGLPDGIHYKKPKSWPAPSDPIFQTKWASTGCALTSPILEASPHKPQDSKNLKPPCWLPDTTQVWSPCLLYYYLLPRKAGDHVTVSVHTLSKYLLKQCTEFIETQSHLWTYIRRLKHPNSRCHS